MRPITIVDPANVTAALMEIERASHDADIVEMAQNFSPDTQSFTATYTINTTTPSLANIANFIATFLTVLQKGGLNRTQ